MTVSMTEAEVMSLVGAVVGVGVLLVMLAVGWVIYLLVRPPRRRDAPPPETVDYAEILAVMERMERRMEVLERAVGPEGTPQIRVFDAGAERLEQRRTK